LLSGGVTQRLRIGFDGYLFRVKREQGSRRCFERDTGLSFYHQPSA
jgi:hypothetical protein